MKRILENRGFSLVETMVAVGLTAGLGYVLMSQTEMTKKQQQKTDFNQLVNSQAAAIQKELGKSENCTATFKDLAFGTATSPTVVGEIKKGLVNLATTPPTITAGPVLFKTRQAGASGIYIDSMHLIRRPGDSKEVLRVTFASGDVVGTTTRDRTKGFGASRVPKDFFIMTQKNSSNVITTCYSESTNLMNTACLSMPGGVWNPTTQKCDITGIVKRSDLVQIWTTKNGGIATTRPADSENGEVTCQRSGKKCSRAGGSDCSLPACPAGHYHSTPWSWNRDQSSGWGVDHACMKSAKCMYSSQPAGWMVKP